ncbi:MAG: DUF2073 domain-containing protein [Candidatus Aenigmatarchaeota archaeon]|nr:DUF2073 domain-containing protein [Nanoarchaeota archaeon]
MNVKFKLLAYEKFKKDGFEALIHDLKESKIVLIDAKLSSEQEAYVIEETMKQIGDKFSGIELASLSLLNEEALGGFEKFKNAILETIIGKKRGFTIIGPAKIVHKIKKNPEELTLLM